MLAIRPHRSQDYAQLPNIDEYDGGVLTPEDEDCLSDLGHLVLSLNAYERFGVTLLHRHFSVRDNETLIEELSGPNSLTLRPRDSGTSGLTPTNISFESHAEDLRLIGLEFTSAPLLCGVPGFSGFDIGVLEYFRRILTRWGKLGRFGIRLLHDPLHLNGRVLLETCDEMHRILTCAITSADDTDFLRSIPTVFCWQPLDITNNNWAINQGCMQFCKRIQGCVRDRSGNHRSTSSHEPSHGDAPD